MLNVAAVGLMQAREGSEKELTYVLKEEGTCMIPLIVRTGVNDSSHACLMLASGALHIHLF